MSWRTEVGNYVIGYDPGDDRSASACVVVLRKNDDGTQTSVGDVTGEAARLIGDYVSGMEAEVERVKATAEAECNYRIGQHDCQHRRALNKIADRLGVVHEDDRIVAAAVALERFRGLRLRHNEEMERRTSEKAQAESRVRALGAEVERLREALDQGRAIASRFILHQGDCWELRTEPGDLGAGCNEFDRLRRWAKGSPSGR